ncbi:hypothetical protein POG22_09650 [Geitlerinema sp. CS-897]|nr:hypothetical protein [Geitlerinema sp. CS-897]
MNIHWKIFILKGALWLASEVVLTITGTDDLADYSEFVFERYLIHPKARTYSDGKNLNNVQRFLFK